MGTPIYLNKRLKYITAELRSQRAWTEYAACTQTDPEAFFPESGREYEDAITAKEICAECPVRRACLRWAIEHHEVYGIWGGMGILARNTYARTHRMKPTPIPNTV